MIIAKFKIKEIGGFTLIELLVVISIIGFLASMAVYALNVTRVKARDAWRLGDLDSLYKAFQLYADDHGGRLPATGAANCIGVPTGQTCWGDRNVPGNDSLLSALSTYSKNLPTDPLSLRGWGDRYLYLDGATSLTGCNGDVVVGHYILWRPDKQPGSDSDCLRRGNFSCCGSGGAPCGNPGGYYCAFKID